MHDMQRHCETDWNPSEDFYKWHYKQIQWNPSCTRCNITQALSSPPVTWRRTPWFSCCDTRREWQAGWRRMVCFIWSPKCYKKSFISSSQLNHNTTTTAFNCSISNANARFVCLCIIMWNITRPVVLKLIRKRRRRLIHPQQLLLSSFHALWEPPWENKVKEAWRRWRKGKVIQRNDLRTSYNNIFNFFPH